MIDTTINIDERILGRVRESAKQLNMPESKIVRKLLRKMIVKTGRSIKLFSSVKYQKNNGQKVWKKYHLLLSPQMYERCLDLRKVYKFSVSFFFSMEVEESLDLIVKQLFSGDCSDNYLETYSIQLWEDESEKIYVVKTKKKKNTG